MVEGKSVIWVCERQRRTLFLLGLFVYLSLKTRFRDNNQPTRHNSWCGTAEHLYNWTISTAECECRCILCRARTSVFVDLTSLGMTTRIISP